jgi:hypothetical protein
MDKLVYLTKRGWKVGRILGVSGAKYAVQAASFMLQVIRQCQVRKRGEIGADCWWVERLI